MEFKQVLIISSLKFLLSREICERERAHLKIAAASELRRMYGTCRAIVAPCAWMMCMKLFQVIKVLGFSIGAWLIRRASEPHTCDAN